MFTDRDNMTLQTVVNAIVGAAMVFGGIMGYMKGSIASLAAGGLSGLALLVAAKLMHSKNGDGVILSAVVTGVVTVVMSLRFVATRSPLPGGVAALCLVTFIIDAVWLLKKFQTIKFN